MKKLLVPVFLLMALLPISAQNEGNPFQRLGYNTPVYTFGEDKEFHDQEVIVEIDLVLYNTKTNKVVGFVKERDSLVEFAPELQSMSIDPLCEKYYSISPYAYCFNNPVKFVDPDGRDPFNPQHWKQFGKDLVKATTASVSIGLQVSGEFRIASSPVGVDVNLGSIDLFGMKDGVIFTPATNTDKSEIKQGFDIGVGLLGGGVQKSIKTEDGQKVLEEKGHIGTVLAEVEKKETTPINDNYSKIGPTNSETNVRVPDIGYKSKVGIGTELSVDVNKVWDALKDLILKD